MVERKKILFIVEAMGGGVFTYIVDLANSLADMTDDGSPLYEMYIAYGLREQTPCDYKRYFDKRIKLIEVKNFTRSVSPTKDVKALFELKRIAKDVKPDIIHLHSSKAGALGRVAFSGLRIDGRRVSLFYTPHGYSFLMQDCSAPKRFVYKLIETVCGKLDCTTVSCSAGEHAESQRLAVRAAYVNNGIDCSKLKSSLSELKVKEHPFTVFTLGRICPQKNPSLFNSVAEAMPDVRFLWIGDGELRSELTAENIEISSWEDRMTALEDAVSGDVFILTSLWEGLPMSLLEAMYMQKPCVVSDVIGNHDVIKNGENGFVCSAASEFADAIKNIRKDMSTWLLKDESGAVFPVLKPTDGGETERLVKKAYRDVLEKYNTSVMAESYSEVYKASASLPQRSLDLKRAFENAE